MNIESLAAWGEFLGGVAVVVGLIFVGIQVRISNQEARIAANDRYAKSMSDVGLLLASNPDLSEIFTRGISGIENLEEKELVRFLTYLSNGVFPMYENIYSQYQSGRIEQRVWDGAENRLKLLAGSKGFQDVWALRSSWYEENFQYYIGTIIEDNQDVGELAKHYSDKGN